MKKQEHKNMTTKELWREILNTIKGATKFTEKDKESFTELLLMWKIKQIRDKLKKAGISADVEVTNKK